jgi:four helix bundle protein
MKNQKFRRLDIWIDSMKFIEEIYKLSCLFPADEKFGLISQLKRASVSIALNIAEGSGSGSDLEFRRFLKISLRSIYEVMTILEIASSMKFADQDIIELRIKDADHLAAMISNFIKRLTADSRQPMADYENY